MTSFTAACVQLNVGNDMDANIARASTLVREAANTGAVLITMPENVALMPVSGRDLFAHAYQCNDHPAYQAFTNLASELDIWLLIGSLALKREEGNERLANCSLLINPDGELVQHYDKIHLYDVELDNGEIYDESRRYMGGKQAKLVDLPWGKLGMTVCYDIRFPHLYRQLAQSGAQFITVPAAFTKYTGQAHWHTLLRARAIENGCYIIAPALTGKHPANRETFGHSLIIDPWGKELADAGEGEGIIIAEIDAARVEEVRKALPSLQHDQHFDI